MQIIQVSEAEAKAAKCDKGKGCPDIKEETTLGRERELFFEAQKRGGGGGVLKLSKPYEI